MRQDIDYIISLMKRYTPQNEGELDEQDAGPSGGSSSDYPSVSHWSEVVGGPARGKANQISDTSKWDSGVTRGVANQIK